MTSTHMIEQEKSVLRWGGMAGLIGSILFILVMVFVAVVIGDDPANLQAVVARFPEIHMLRVIENGIYLIALLLEILLFISLFWALRNDSLMPALFGSLLGIVGLVSMAISATPHVAHFPLSELFQESAITPEAQEAIALMWQGTWGVFNAPLYVGLFIAPIGILFLGAGMLNAPSFGKWLGWMSIVVGGIAFVTAILQMIDPASDIGALSYLLPIIFYFVVGLKTYRLSRAA